MLSVPQPAPPLTTSSSAPATLPSRSSTCQIHRRLYQVVEFSSHPYHRYTDAKLDLYNANRGLFYFHIVWMGFKPVGAADVSDPIVHWQYMRYVKVILCMGCDAGTDRLAASGSYWAQVHVS
ncbi:hypothetical protein BDQ17DRAFT_1435600 [Cyathus striatus]|nr:hypothetical protein BDQ17DRAFT_1435600 [Cyathus striatus]